MLITDQEFLKEMPSQPNSQNCSVFQSFLLELVKRTYYYKYSKLASCENNEITIAINNYNAKGEIETKLSLLNCSGASAVIRCKWFIDTSLNYKLRFTIGDNTEHQYSNYEPQFNKEFIPGKVAMEYVSPHVQWGCSNYDLNCAIYSVFSNFDKNFSFIRTIGQRENPQVDVQPRIPTMPTSEELEQQIKELQIQLKATKDQELKDKYLIPLALNKDYPCTDLKFNVDKGSIILKSLNTGHTLVALTPENDKFVLQKNNLNTLLRKMSSDYYILNDWRDTNNFNCIFFTNWDFYIFKGDIVVR